MKLANGLMLGLAIVEKVVAMEEKVGDLPGRLEVYPYQYEKQNGLRFVYFTDDLAPQVGVVYSYRGSITVTTGGAYCFCAVRGTYGIVKETHKQAVFGLTTNDVDEAASFLFSQLTEIDVCLQ